MRYLLIIILMLGTISTRAQVKFELGAATSVDVGKYHYSTDVIYDKPTAALTISPAIMLGLNVNNKISIHTGLQHLSKGDNDILTFTNSSGETIGTHNLRYRYRYLSSPLNISYNFLKKDNKLSAGLMALSDFSWLYAIHYNDFLGIDKQGNFTTQKTTAYYSNNKPNVFRQWGISAGGGLFAGYRFSNHINGCLNLHVKTDIISLDKTPLFEYRYVSAGCALGVMYRF